jgi:hypothetical protein
MAHENVTIKLEAEELLALDEILLEKDQKKALEFLEDVVAKKVAKRQKSG